jgi:hypothetical protein
VLWEAYNSAGGLLELHVSLPPGREFEDSRHPNRWRAVLGLGVMDLAVALMTPSQAWPCPPPPSPSGAESPWALRASRARNSASRRSATCSVDSLRRAQWVVILQTAGREMEVCATGACSALGAPSRNPTGEINLTTSWHASNHRSLILALTTLPNELLPGVMARLMTRQCVWATLAHVLCIPTTLQSGRPHLLRLAMPALIRSVQFFLSFPPS